MHLLQLYYYKSSKVPCIHKLTKPLQCKKKHYASAIFDSTLFIRISFLKLLKSDSALIFYGNKSIWLMSSFNFTAFLSYYK